MMQLHTVPGLRKKVQTLTLLLEPTAWLYQRPAGCTGANYRIGRQQHTLSLAPESEAVEASPALASVAKTL